LPFGTRLEVETDSRTYMLEVLRAGYVMISGHPRHCPEPIVAQLCRPGDSIDARWITEGTSLKYFHPARGVIRTSSVRRISEVSQPALPRRVADVRTQLRSSR
jgi:hypothetical protein